MAELQEMDGGSGDTTESFIRTGFGPIRVPHSLTAPLTGDPVAQTYIGTGEGSYIAPGETVPEKIQEAELGGKAKEVVDSGADKLSSFFLDRANPFPNGRSIGDGPGNLGEKASGALPDGPWLPGAGLVKVVVGLIVLAVFLYLLRPLFSLAANLTG